MEDHHGHTPIFNKNWRDESAKVEDRSTLAAKEKELSAMQGRRDKEKLLFGKQNSGLSEIYPRYEGDKELNKLNSEVERRRKDEKSY